MALHTLQDPALLERCLAALTPDDTLLLIDSAVYLAASDQTLARAPCPVYVLQSDIATAGIDAESLSVTLASEDDWVTLSEKHRQHVAWY